MKLKRCVIVTGTVMGILGAFVGMMPSSRRRMLPSWSMMPKT